MAGIIGSRWSADVILWLSIGPRRSRSENSLAGIESSRVRSTSFMSSSARVASLLGASSRDAGGFGYRYTRMMPFVVHEEGVTPRKSSRAARHSTAIWSFTGAMTSQIALRTIMDEAHWIRL